MSFINPVKDGKIEKSFSSEKVEITSYESDNVICPYDGQVAEYDSDKCGGRLKIKHDLNGKVYYSVFCNITNVPKSVQTPLTKVYQRTKLGEIAGNTLLYAIEDEKNSKKNVESFIGAKKTKEKEEDKKEKCSSQQEYDYTKKKCVNKKTELETKSSSDSKIEEPITALMTDLALSPFQFASDIFNPDKRREERKKREEEKQKKEEEEKKKEEEEKNKKEEQLTEEIKRIKQLLK